MSWDSWSDLVPEAIAVIAESTVMATALIAAALLAAKVLNRSRASAALRCQIWSGAAVGLILLPLASWLLPAWQLPVAAGEWARLPTIPAQAPVGDWSVGRLLADPRQLFSHWATSSALLIVASWSLGCLIVAVRTLFGWLSLLQLQRRSEYSARGDLHRQIDSLRTRSGVTFPVRVLVSEQRALPMAWGIWCPTIHLPFSARTWCPEGRAAVVLHELAHLKRHDYLYCLLSRVACAMYWFHPLVWYLRRRLRAEQELACDDLVLSWGVSPATYADQLMRVTLGQRWESVVAPGVGRRHALARRIHTILDRDAIRQRPSCGQAWGSAVALAMTVVVIATAGPLRVETDSRDSQLADGIETQQFFETLRAKSAERFDLAAIDADDVDRWLRDLDDAQAAYYSPVEVEIWRDQVRGQITGIGAKLNTTEDRTVVEFPLVGSPAQHAGLQTGDTILQVDGRSTEGLTSAEVVGLIRGPAGSPVSLVVSRGTASQQIRVVRGAIPLPSVHGLPEVPSTGERFMVSPDDGIAYFRLSQVSNQTPAELRERLAVLDEKGLRGAILDLRFCPGGALDAAVDIADLFLRGGDVATVRGWDGTEIILRATNAAVADFPLVVLINGQTASAAEVVAGALQDHGRATVVGTRSQGKGTVQSLVPLQPGQGAVRLTTATYYPPSGREIDRKPGSKSWGIDADRGHFVPVSESQLATLKRRLQSSVSFPSPAEVDEFTPEHIRRLLGDPQFAAALETLQAQLRKGAPEPVQS